MNDTYYTKRFIEYLGDNVVNKLPQKVCSSKVLYEILKDDLDTYFKQSIFREAFMQYFRWKVTQRVI